MAAPVRVLYVDDESSLLDLCKMYLERAGKYIVTTATSAPEALRILELARFDAIIADYQMPEMDGIEFLKIVRGRGDKTPFIIFTGKGREEVVIEALNSGADFYLQKGGEPKAQFAELSHKIQRAVQHRTDETALVESTERFRALVENTSDIVRILDREGRIVFETPAALRELGYPPGFTLGRHPFEFIHPDDLPVVRHDLSEVYAKTNTGIPTEFRIRKADGSYVWAEAVGKNLIGVPGVDGVVITTRIIEERKKAENALRENEEKFRQLFSKMPSGVAIYEAADDGEDFIFRDFNTAGEDIEHISKENVIGRRVSEVFPGVKEFGLFSVFRRVWRTGKPEFFPSAIYRDAHDPGTWRENWVYRLKTGEIVVIYNDITERKVAEQALIKSQNQLADAMDLAHMANWEFDVASGIFTFNDRFYTLYGTTAEREGGYQMPAEVYAREFVHPDEASLVADEVQNAINATDPNYTRDIEHRIIRRDGKVRHIIVRFAITKDAEGRTVETHGANQDITDRIEAEESIRLSRAFLDRVIDMSPFAMWISDKEGTVVRVNRTLCETINVASDVIVGRYNVLKDVNLEKQGVMPDVKAVFEKHKQARFTIPWKAADAGDAEFLSARDMYIDVAIFPILDAHGDLTNVVCQWVDITERRKAEEMLRKSEERFKAIFDNQLTGLLMVDPATHIIIDANNTALALIGAGKDDVIGKVCHTFICPAELGQCPITDLGQTIDESERVLITVKGERTPIIKSVKHTEIGGKQYLIESFIDITERKKAEEKIRESEERFRDLFDSALDIIQIVRPDGSFLHVNPEWKKTLGYSDEEISTISVFDIFHPDSVAHCSTIFRQLLCNKGAENIEAQFLTKEGKTISVVGDCTPEVKNGTVVSIRGIFHNVTEQKKAEVAICKSEEQYRTLATNIPDIVYRVYLKEEGRMQFFNDQVTALTGYTERELEQGTVCSIEPFIHPDDRKRVFAAVENAITEHGIFTVEYRFLHKGGVNPIL
jgi:PAS domain S-box-containing protein